MGTGIISTLAMPGMEELLNTAPGETTVMAGVNLTLAAAAACLAAEKGKKVLLLADNDLKDLSGQELAEAMKEKIKAKDSNLVGDMTSQGTTPRQLTDLLGSLCDLTSGSGDRGTPVVLIQNYFTNYATE